MLSQHTECVIYLRSPTNWNGCTLVCKYTHTQSWNKKYNLDAQEQSACSTEEHKTLLYSSSRVYTIIKSLCGYLVPPGEQFSIWSFEKSTHICSTKWDTCHREREAHGYSELEMTPFCCIVPSPHCSITLWACVMRPCQDEWSKFTFWPLQQAFKRRHCLKNIQNALVDILLCQSSFITFITQFQNHTKLQGTFQKLPVQSH